MLAGILSAVAGLTAAVAIAAHYRGDAGRRTVYIFKPLTTGIILLIAALSPGDAGGRYRIAICVGLALSIAGDVFLMLPRDRFVAGLGSFLAAHLAYLVAFTRDVTLRAAAPPVAVYAALGMVIYLLLRPGLARRLVLPVAAYVLVIGAMAGTALARWLEVPAAATLSAAAGTALFVVSDALLAIDRFRWPFASARAIVLATYWSAQLLIALSVRG